MPCPLCELFARYGGKALFYLSSSGGGDGLWRFGDGQVVEIWKGSDSTLREPAAVSFDGSRAAVILRKQGKRSVYLLSAEGGDVGPVGDKIDVTSAAAWSPDGKWIATAGNDGTGPGLFKIPLAGGEPIRLTKGCRRVPGVVTGRLADRVHGSHCQLSGMAPNRPAGRKSCGGATHSSEAGWRTLPIRPGDRTTCLHPWIRRLESELLGRWIFPPGNSTAFQLRQFRHTDFRHYSDGKQIVFDRLKDNSGYCVDRPGGRS